MARPQDTKFHDAPCQIPVINHTVMLARYSGALRPAPFPKSLRITSEHFLEARLVDTGKKIYSRNQRIIDMPETLAQGAAVLRDFGRQTS